MDNVVHTFVSRSSDDSQVSSPPAINGKVGIKSIGMVSVYMCITSLITTFISLLNRPLCRMKYLPVKIFCFGNVLTDIHSVITYITYKPVDVCIISDSRK